MVHKLCIVQFRHNHGQERLFCCQANYSERRWMDLNENLESGQCFLDWKLRSGEEFFGRYFG